MTADIRTAGAASHAAEGWHTINWKSAYRIVCRLQARIVKAIQEGRWGKVKALQYLLTHSFSGKALAIRRVTENQGKGTPGVDREIWDTPEKKATALQALRQRGYNPQPLRRVYIPKKNGKMRPLGIPTMRDRAMQALYLQALDPIAETMADPNSYGFRKERSTADAIEQCHIVLSNRGGARWIFEGDIKSCFDRISHEWLMAHIPMCKTILQKWLKAGFMEKHVFYATEEGTPQGGICSPVLANMALDGLERELRGRYPKASALSRKAKVNLVRYADDFIITGKFQKTLGGRGEAAGGIVRGVIAPVPGIMRLFWAFSSSNPPESPSQEDSSLANMLDTLEARCRSDGPPAGPRSIDPLPGSRSFLTVSAVA